MALYRGRMMAGGMGYLVPQDPAFDGLGFRKIRRAVKRAVSAPVKVVASLPGVSKLPAPSGPSQAEIEAEERRIYEQALAEENARLQAEREEQARLLQAGRKWKQIHLQAEQEAERLAEERRLQAEIEAERAEREEQARLEQERLEAEREARAAAAEQGRASLLVNTQVASSKSNTASGAEKGRLPLLLLVGGAAVAAFFVFGSGEG